MSDELAFKKFNESKERTGQRLVTGPQRVFIPRRRRHAYFYLERV
ncbi:MAG: hypothetical protein QOH60_590 [Mycobacterium sp.]|jgi:hypothetical protein|nr:hypothetical protein [Mycobacterium sp.]